MDDEMNTVELSGWENVSNCLVWLETLWSSTAFRWGFRGFVGSRTMFCLWRKLLNLTVVSPPVRDEACSVECGAKNMVSCEGFFSAAPSCCRRFHFILCCLCGRQAIKLSCLHQHASAISPRWLHLRFLLGSASETDRVFLHLDFCANYFQIFFVFALKELQKKNSAV